MNAREGKIMRNAESPIEKHRAHMITKTYVRPLAFMASKKTEAALVIT